MSKADTWSAAAVGTLFFAHQLFNAGCNWIERHNHGKRRAAQANLGNSHSGTWVYSTRKSRRAGRNAYRAAQRAGQAGTASVNLAFLSHAVLKGHMTLGQARHLAGLYGVTVPAGFPTNPLPKGYKANMYTDSLDPLPRSKSDMPILAHRAAKLRPLNEDGLPFRSVAQDFSFGVFERAAECMVLQREIDSHRYADLTNPIVRDHLIHDIPSEFCQCGFYANPPDLKSTYEEPCTVDLLVELMGKVLECDRGYRAQAQHVVEVQLNPCFYGFNRSGGKFCAARSTYLMYHRDSGLFSHAVCKDHAMFFHGKKNVAIPAERLSKEIGVPVTGRDPKQFVEPFNYDIW